MSANPYPEVAVAGSGTIASGLAALASRESSRVTVLVRSAESAARAERSIARTCDRVDGADIARVSVTTDPADLAGARLAVEAIVEDPGAKTGLLATIGDAAPDADLATTTSSLAVGELGDACGHPERLFGLHVFNPVPVMELVELCLPPGLSREAGERATAWCGLIGKTAVVVPDTPGFVVNRLLFPYLFDAVRLKARTGMSAADVDACMTLGVAHPMGPLALLDLVGLDVAVAIGEAINAESGNPDHLAPEAVIELVEAGHLGRKSGRGFFEYK